MADYIDSNCPIILWGAGYYYSTVKDYIKYSIAVDYIHDKKWDNSDITEFDGYQVISLEEMKNIGKCMIISCLSDIDIEKEIHDEISRNMSDAQIYSVRNIIPIGRNLRKEEIIEKARGGEYIDFYGNCIQYSNVDSLNKVNIRFIGSNAKIKLGREVWVANELNIVCGNNGIVKIGDGTTFDKATLYSAYGDIEIGSDCMISYEVFIRNHDSHFIFDAQTGNRINYNRSIKIGNHTWVGQNSILLAGFAIGGDSMIGAGSITSSVFQNKVIIAGNPARVIRDGIMWHRNMTWTEDYNNINEI